MMSSDVRNFSWKGIIAIIILLVVVSIIAYILSSIEGFLAGIVVIFIGFLLSFFRDDIKRAVGLDGSPQPPPIKEEEKDILIKLDKKIAKERQNIAKLISKYDEKPKKQEKIGLEIVEETTALLSLIDQAKSQAIQKDDENLVRHYDEIALEIEEIRSLYQN